MSQMLIGKLIMFSVGAILIFPWLLVNMSYIILYYKLKKKYPESCIPFSLPVFHGLMLDEFPFTEDEVRKELQRLRRKSLACAAWTFFVILVLSVLI